MVSPGHVYARSINRSQDLSLFRVVARVIMFGRGITFRDQIGKTPRLERVCINIPEMFGKAPITDSADRPVWRWTTRLEQVNGACIYSD